MILTFFFMTMVASVLIGNCRGTRISVYHPSLASLTPDGYKKGNDGYLYKLHKEPKSWTDAQNACNGEDGNLAIIFNEKTRDVVHFLSEGLTVWIGATDQWEEGKWQTVTKEDIPYTFWYKGEPNDAYGGEDCAGMYSSKLMNDWRCYQAKPFVCQKAGKASTQSFEIFKKLTKISNNVKDIKDFVQGIYNKVVSGKHDPSFRKCCETLDCSKYRGKKKTTASGRLCQPWNSDVPHIINSDTKASMKSAGLTANYCRNPTQASTAWCYTMDEDKRWEYCDIPICSDVDDCGSQPCKHGNCIDEVDAYTCKCNVGYTGENCEINIDDCGSHLCKHGNCIDGVDAYYCQCYVGYTGEYCEIKARALVSAIWASPSDTAFIDSDSAWQKPVFCPNNTFVNGFKSWQDDSYGDHKGLTQIVFSCVDKEGRSQSWIKSGVGLGKETQARYCRSRSMYFIGVKVIFGGSSVGAVALKPICDIPDWSSSTSPSQRHMIVHNIPIFSPSLNPGRTDWYETDELLCGNRAVVCGLNTSVDGTEGVTAGLLTDESGINEIELFCCWVPK